MTHLTFELICGFRIISFVFQIYSYTMSEDDNNLQQNAPPPPDFVAADPPPEVGGVVTWTWRVVVVGMAAWWLFPSLNAAYPS